MDLRRAIEAWPAMYTDDETGESRGLDFQLEVRSTPTGFNFRGYAAVFDSPSEDLGGFIETIDPVAFNRSLARRKGDIRMFLNHNWDIVLGSKGAGTLRMAADGHGLFVDDDLPDNEWGRPVRDGVERGDITSMSFGFNVPKGGDSWSADRKERRLTEIYLREVSPITAWPAYPATSASVRHLAELIDEPQDVLEAAVRVLFMEDGSLTDEQHDLLQRAIGARTSKPYIPPATHELLTRLMAKRPAA